MKEIIHSKQWEELHLGRGEGRREHLRGVLRMFFKNRFHLQCNVFIKYYTVIENEFT